MLEPTHYALGGAKFIPHRPKQFSEIQFSRTFVETVKGPIQERDMKQFQQPIIKEKGRNRLAEKKAEYPRDKPCAQVVVFESQAGKSLPTAVDGVEGRDHCINVENKFKAKNLEGNKHRFPLRFNLNSKYGVVGKEREIRTSCWLGKGLIVELNENGKRKVMWEHNKGADKSASWVAKGNKDSVLVAEGLGPYISQAHPLMGSTKSILGPCGFEVGECSKSSQANCGPNTIVGLGPYKQTAQDLLGNKNFKASESSIRGINALEPSIQNGISIQSSGRSELTATKELESSMVSANTTEQPAMSPKVQHSPTPLTQPPTVLTGALVVAQASHIPLLTINAPSGSRLVPVVSSAMISELVMTFIDPIVSALVSLTSQVASDDGDEDFVGSEGSAPTNSDSNFEGADLPGPTIKELVGDLDKSWGNSKDWILQLHDARQIVLPLSLYRSPDCMSVCLSLEGDSVPGNVSTTNEGQRGSWANEGEGLVESSSMVPRLENEMWESDERLRFCEKGDEPLVVVPLATEGPLELVSSHVKEFGCKESGDNCQISQWVTNRIKAFKKSVGTSLEGFE